MLNMDFSKRIVVDTTQQEWLASPTPGVWRKPLAREEAERGHATSLVKYDPGSAFKSHEHPGGEEIIVLAGTFSDQYGDFPKGTYFRNPPGTRHAPNSRSGCVLFVKLHQFQAHDSKQCSIDTINAKWKTVEAGIDELMLHQCGNETVLMQKWHTHTQGLTHKHSGGEEIYVLSGKLRDEHGIYPVGTWLRQPSGSSHQPFVEEETILWVKRGHLAPNNT